MSTRQVAYVAAHYGYSLIIAVPMIILLLVLLALYPITKITRWSVIDDIGDFIMIIAFRTIHFRTILLTKLFRLDR